MRALKVAQACKRCSTQSREIPGNLLRTDIGLKTHSPVYGSSYDQIKDGALGDAAPPSRGGEAAAGLAAARHYNATAGAAAASARQRRREERGPDKDEEDYFSEADDDTPPRPRGWDPADRGAGSPPPRLGPSPASADTGVWGGVGGEGSMGTARGRDLHESRGSGGERPRLWGGGDPASPLGRAEPFLDAPTLGKRETQDVGGPAASAAAGREPGSGPDAKRPRRGEDVDRVDPVPPPPPP